MSHYEAVSENARWRYDYVEHYRLNERIINDFLANIWGGGYQYFVSVSPAPPVPLDQVARF